MTAAWFDRLSAGLSRTREQIGDRIAELVGRGPDVGEEFWEGLEEALIAADMGAPAAVEIVEGVRTFPTPRPSAKRWPTSSHRSYRRNRTRWRQVR